MVQIITPKTDTEFAEARHLINAYAAWLGVNLHFQAFDAEMDGYPDTYDSIRIAKVNESFIGVVAHKRFNETICEMKRLYCLPEKQGQGVGRALTTAIIEDARGLDYKHIYLDTMKTMTTARGLYRSLGFVEIDAYYDNPLDVAYMG